MKLVNTFYVPASPSAVWDTLNDVPRVVPCMPGAVLTDVVDENAWKVRMAVKLGSVALEFIINVQRGESDKADGRTVLTANAKEARGRGSAMAQVVSKLSPSGDGTAVDLHTDLRMHGAIAQYGQGLVADVAARILDEFAGNLAPLLAAGA